jgi:replication factor A1
MTTIKDVYQDLDSDISFEEFEEQVDQKVNTMNGLVDRDAAAVLIADGLSSGEVQNIEEISAGVDEVEFFGKILSIGELNSFSRDDGTTGTVCNIDVGDETEQIRIALWDEMAEDANEVLQIGDVLQVEGTPKDGYSGLEVSASSVDVRDDIDIDIRALESYQVTDLTQGLSGVSIKGLVIGTTPVNTFERNDGSEGKVANIIIGDETGEVQVTLWGDAADAVENYRVKQSVQITNGDVKDGDNGLEIHLNSSSDVTHIKEQIKYEPETILIGDIQLDEVVNLAGGVTYLGEKETFDRDDGSSGKVRNLNLEDDTGSIRVSLWGDKAETDVNVGDEILITNAEIQQGWEDEPEASTGYRSAILVTGRGSYDINEDDEEDVDGSSSSEERKASIDDYDTETAPSGSAATDTDSDGAIDQVQINGTVVIVGEEVIVNTSDGEQTVEGVCEYDLHLGQTVTVRGTRTDDGCITATEVF